MIKSLNSKCDLWSFFLPLMWPSREVEVFEFLRDLRFKWLFYSIFLEVSSSWFLEWLSFGLSYVGLPCPFTTGLCLDLLRAAACLSSISFMCRFFCFQARCNSWIGTRSPGLVGGECSDKRICPGESGESRKGKTMEYQSSWLMTQNLDIPVWDNQLRDFKPLEKKKASSSYPKYHHIHLLFHPPISKRVISSIIIFIIEVIHYHTVIQKVQKSSKWRDYCKHFTPNFFIHPSMHMHIFIHVILLVITG